MPAKTTPPPARETPTPSPVPEEAVTPLIRGIAVLTELTAAGGTMSLSDLERATGLARSTVDRIAATLARMGYVRLDGRDAVLAPPVMELGNAYLAALRLPALLSARADALADDLDESVSLAVADRDGIRFIHQATRRRAMSLSFRIGDLLPAERTAPGPLFATEWTDADWNHWRTRLTTDPHNHGFPAIPPRHHPAPNQPGANQPGAGEGCDDDTTDFVRRTAKAKAEHWALDDQLIEPGLVAVSAPVRDPLTSRIACVASIVSHTSRHTAADLQKVLLPRLRTAVAAMEEDLRQAPPAEPGPSPAGLALWTGASKQELGREFIESLARGLTVLTAFGTGRAALTLTEVAKATGLARATARRSLITYDHLGLVTPTADRAFALTPRVLSLGFPPLSRTSLPHIATPHMAALTDLLHESTSLAVLTDRPDHIRYTAHVPARHVMSVHLTVGTRLPAAGTSAGTVLLAGRAEVSERTEGAGLAEGDRRTKAEGTITARSEAGYALMDEELEEGLRTIAVPIRDRNGRTVAALTAATHAARRTLEECVRDILPALTTTASHIETDLQVASRFTHVPLT
ncbi:IclR family transcriptional regulator C-terminal domain-containing protein [Streptomyces sp. NPDC006527]|uniref:IclR family transcriptional regulator domain-containing protein n=1 Tax=Streptomyces sp. NPDC006527 TaxID=3364749 RepID=UPI00368B5917